MAKTAPLLLYNLLDEPLQLIFLEQVSNQEF